MARKNEEVRSKNEEMTAEVVQEPAEEVTAEDLYNEGKTDTSLVYNLSTLFEMKFRDPLNGQIVMVRRAFKPRGKLEFYCPEKN